MISKIDTEQETKSQRIKCFGIFELSEYNTEITPKIIELNVIKEFHKDD